MESRRAFLDFASRRVMRVGATSPPGSYSKKRRRRKGKHPAGSLPTAFKADNGRCFRVSNIKIRFQTIQPFANVKCQLELLSDLFCVSLRGNTFTVRTEHCVFVCFYSGHCNATGFTRIEKVPEFLELFSLLFPGYLAQPRSTPFIIDNISLFGRIGKTAFSSFPHDVARFENLPSVRYSFNNFAFPGATLRGKHGTLVLFQNGSILILGVKDRAHFEHFQRLINYMLKRRGKLLHCPRDEMHAHPF